MAAFVPNEFSIALTKEMQDFVNAKRPLLANKGRRASLPTIHRPQKTEPSVAPAKARPTASSGQKRQPRASIKSGDWKRCVVTSVKRDRDFGFAASEGTEAEGTEVYVRRDMLNQIAVGLRVGSEFEALIRPRDNSPGKFYVAAARRVP